MSRKPWYGLAIGLASAGLALVLWFSGALDALENATWLWRVRALAQRTAATPKIKLILVDQYSLDWAKRELGWSWPWPREGLAPVLDFCRRGGAKAVAFDVLYTEPSVYGVEDDQRFGAAIQRGAPFVSAVMAAGKDREFKTWPGTPTPETPVIRGLEAWKRANPHWQSEQSATFSVPEVNAGAAMLGHVSSLPDRDGIYRRNALFRVFDGRVLPSLGLAAYLAGNAQGGTPPALRIEPGWFTVGDVRLPINTRGQALIRFTGPSGTHQAYSVSGVIQSEDQILRGERPLIDPAELKDCYVFFGYSAPTLYDLQPTPVGNTYPGVEIHATMLDNLLARQSLRETPRSMAVGIVGLLCLVSALAGVYSRRAWQSAVGFLLFLLLPLGMGFAAYRLGWWWPVMVGEVGAGLSMVSAMVFNYATEGRQKAFLKNAFRHYLGAEVIEQILADPSRLRLGGEKRELSIFFSDIEKFSSFSEKLDPPVLTALLNDYLSDMSAIIQEEGGYLDKYIGDAIVAFWNAPLDQPDHAERACRAAVRCQRRLEARRQDFARRTGVVMKARVGLNTGVVAVGNMGSYERFNYTILGDAANLASRLEGANKAFGTYTLVAESTWEEGGGAFAGRELGRLRVVGRQAPVRVFELIGLVGDPVPAHFPAFADALALFYAGDFRQALAAFESLAEDPPSRAYAQQCRALLEHPPTDWDGVLSLTEK